MQKLKKHRENMELHRQNIQLILKVGFKLERAFQHITLYYQYYLKKFFPTLWYVQASTQTLQVFQEGDLKGTLSGNIHKRKV